MSNNNVSSGKTSLTNHFFAFQLHPHSVKARVQVPVNWDARPGCFGRKSQWPKSSQCSLCGISKKRLILLCAHLFQFVSMNSHWGLNLADKDAAPTATIQIFRRAMSFGKVACVHFSESAQHNYDRFRSEKRNEHGAQVENARSPSVFAAQIPSEAMWTLKRTSRCFLVHK